MSTSRQTFMPLKSLRCATAAAAVGLALTKVPGCLGAVMTETELLDRAVLMSSFHDWWWTSGIKATMEEYWLKCEEQGWLGCPDLGFQNAPDLATCATVSAAKACKFDTWVGSTVCDPVNPATEFVVKMTGASQCSVTTSTTSGIYTPESGPLLIGPKTWLTDDWSDNARNFSAVWSRPDDPLNPDNTYALFHVFTIHATMISDLPSPAGIENTAGAVLSWKMTVAESDYNVNTGTDTSVLMLVPSFYGDGSDATVVSIDGPGDVTVSGGMSDKAWVEVQNTGIFRLFDFTNGRGSHMLINPSGATEVTLAEVTNEGTLTVGGTDANVFGLTNALGGVAMFASGNFIINGGSNAGALWISGAATTVDYFAESNDGALYVAGGTFNAVLTGNAGIVNISTSAAATVTISRYHSGDVYVGSHRVTESGTYGLSTITIAVASIRAMSQTLVVYGATARKFSDASKASMACAIAAALGRPCAKVRVTHVLDGGSVSFEAVRARSLRGASGGDSSAAAADARRRLLMSRPVVLIDYTVSFSQAEVDGGDLDVVAAAMGALKGDPGGAAVGAIKAAVAFASRTDASALVLLPAEPEEIAINPTMSPTPAPRVPVKPATVTVTTKSAGKKAEATIVDFALMGAAGLIGFVALVVIATVLHRKKVVVFYLPTMMKSVEMVEKKKDKKAVVGERKTITIEQLFAVLDSDGDGNLTKEEIMAGAHKMNLTPEEAGDLFDEMDTDGDGSLTKMEFYFAPEEIDEALQNFNGTMEEIAAAVKKGNAVQGIVGPEVDLDGEGKKTYSLNELFDLVDLNGDGELTRDEVTESYLKLNMTEAEAGELFDSLDLDKSGRLTRKDFSDKSLASTGKSMSFFTRKKPLNQGKADPILGTKI